MVYWSDQQLAQVTPPQARDLRGHAAVGVVDRHFDANPLNDFFIRAADTCPAQALPALIAEYSLEEFIAPGLPLLTQRAIIASAWRLQESKGYDDGVLFGLSLLGMTAEIEHWYEATPRRAPNTHTITFFIDRQVFDDSGAFGLREISAARRMVNATKRHSQDTELKLGLRADTSAYVGTWASAHVLPHARPEIPPPPLITVPVQSTVFTTAHIRADARPPED